MKIIHRLIVILGIILIIGYGYLYSRDDQVQKNTSAAIDPASFIQSCILGDYEAIARYPDANKGKHIYVKASVIQVMEAENNLINMRLQDADGNIWYSVYTYKNGEGHILVGDTLTFYGLCYGTYTYTTVFGQGITIPCIDVYFVR